MAFENCTPETISVCDDCLFMIEYGYPSEDATSEQGTAHLQAMLGTLGVPDLRYVVNGCGRDCPDHGLAAYDGDEEAYKTALESRDVETSFSNSRCEGCGGEAGTRQHATVFCPNDQ